MNLSSSMALMPCEWNDQKSVPLLNDETHVWAIPLKKSPPYQELQLQWLSSREKTKAQRMLVLDKRDHQIQARAWLRWLLAGYLDTSPQHVQYKYGTLGKPYIDDLNRQIYFNATDSGNTLLCAFSLNNEMGLDVESTPRKVNYHRIAKKKFSVKEQAAINSLKVVDQSNAFLAIWTRKEAFGKALGLGIRYPMRQYDLCDDFNSYRHQITDQKDIDWYLFQFNYQNNIACLVSRQTHEKICFYKLDIESVELQ